MKSSTLEEEVVRHGMAALWLRRWMRELLMFEEGGESPLNVVSNLTPGDSRLGGERVG
jgi:hypothetical protein